MSQPKTSTQRSAVRAEAQKALGRVPRQVWAAPEEHERVKLFLIGLRKTL